MKDNKEATIKSVARTMKVSEKVAEMRTLPVGVDQRSAARHPDFLGGDDLAVKIEELREATDWTVPIFVKMGASRVRDDVKLAVKAGADVIVLDGLEGATGASPEILLDHTAIPTMSALVEAVKAALLNRSECCQMCLWIAVRALRRLQIT